MEIKVKKNNLANYKQYLKIRKLTKNFLQKKGYLEINLPVLSPTLIPESYLEIFETELRYLGKKKKLYLTPSPELFLKRLIIAGIGSCYSLGKSFRNQEANSKLHSFEFDMLEYYKVGVDYMGLADELLELLKWVNGNLAGGKKDELVYQGKTISLKKWEKLSVAQAFKKYAQIEKKELFNHDLFIKKAKQKGYQTRNFSYQDLWSQIYTAEIEPYLGNNGYPSLIYNYPKEFAALAKLNLDRKTAQRFEFYIAGIELGDCYTELTNWEEQEYRFLLESKKRTEAGKINHPIDRGFINSLKKGLPHCSGIAIGFDRLAMVFANLKEIKNLKLIQIY